MSPWKVILATMVIFGCGVVTGGLLTKTVLPTPGIIVAGRHKSSATNSVPPLNQFQQPSFLKRIQKQLDLTQDQHDRIAEIMHRSQERTRPIWVLVSPQLHVEMKRVREEIRNVLDADQRQKFDELLRAHPRRETPPLRPNGPRNRPMETNGMTNSV